MTRKVLFLHKILKLEKYHLKILSFPVTSGVTATVYNVTQSQSVKVEATTNGKITINN
ncbi:MAG: hypothetical protein IIY81_05205 [Lachnospiraceae bacterium]|nr:hypothetical protein [Lachnospiraceae bacterium]